MSREELNNQTAIADVSNDHILGEAAGATQEEAPVVPVKLVKAPRTGKAKNSVAIAVAE